MRFVRECREGVEDEATTRMNPPERTLERTTNPSLPELFLKNQCGGLPNRLHAVSFIACVRFGLLSLTRTIVHFVQK